jgi:hypothetical protein
MGRVMATVYLNANEAAARHVDTHQALKRYRDGVTRRAKQNLAAANKTTRVSKTGYFPARIEDDEGDVEYYTALVAPNAMALEFGHEPSGVFAGTDTKPPDAEYILSRAAIAGSVS